MLSLQGESPLSPSEKGEGKREIGLRLVQCHPSQMIFFIDSISLSVFCLEPQVALARIASAEDCL
jgi:hypothetical protein